MFYVYKIINTENGKIYIGKTNNVNKRWIQHIYDSRYKPTYFGRAICKYGEDAFDIDVIDSHENEDVAYALERHWIEKLDSTNPNIGYNLAEGGKGGFCGVIPSEETRDKMSKASKARKRNPHTEQAKQKLKEARAKQNRQLLNIGLKNQVLGMYRTNNYTKQQVADRFGININTVKSIIRQGVGLDKFEPYKMPEEQKRRRSKANLGRVVSDETRKRMSESRVGKKHGPMSEQHKARISKSLNERYEISNELKDNIIKDYKRLVKKREIAEKHGVSIDCVDKATKGLSRVSPLTGRSLTKEHKEKISKAGIGRICSDESRDKISAANSGESNGMYGRTHSNETRAKMSESQRTRIRRPISEEQKNNLRLKFKGKPKPPRIPESVKLDVKKDYATGGLTKRQLADKYGVKYNSIVNILRRAPE